MIRHWYSFVDKVQIGSKTLSSRHMQGKLGPIDTSLKQQLLFHWATQTLTEMKWLAVNVVIRAGPPSAVHATMNSDSLLIAV